MYDLREYKVEFSIEDGIYYAKIPRIGAIGDGTSFQEAYDEVLEVVESYMEIALEDGTEIQRPERYDEEESLSGKLLLRISKSVHRMLKICAGEEGVSINQLLNQYISMGLGDAFGRQNCMIKHGCGDISEKVDMVSLDESWSNSEGPIVINFQRELGRKDHGEDDEYMDGGRRLCRRI